MSKKSSNNISRTPIHHEIKAIRDGEKYKIEVNAIPYGLDEHKEYFDNKTDTWVKIGETRPHIHFHGLDDNLKPVEDPIRFKNNLEYARKDKYGHWFESELDPNKPIELELWKAAREGKAAASSDAAKHLIRTTSGGRIKIWALTAISTFITGGRNIPANSRAVVLATKMMYDFEELPDVFSEGAESPRSAGEKFKSKKGDSNMNEKELSLALGNALKADRVLQAEEKKSSEESDRAALKTGLKFMGMDVSDKVADQLLEADPETRIDAIKTVTSKKFSSLGSGGKPEDGPVEQFEHFMKHHDPTPAIEAGLGMEISQTQIENSQKALLGGGIAGGAIAIPPLYITKVDEYLKEESIMRKMGTVGIKTNADEYILHIESSNQGVYEINNADADTAFDEDDPNLIGKEVQMYDYDKGVRVKNKFVKSTSGKHLTQYVINALNDMRAETENSILATGTGLNQPEGPIIGGTIRVTAASQTVVAAAEVPELYYSITGRFRRKKNVGFLASDTLEGGLRALRDSNNWVFLPHPSGGPGEVDWDSLLGRNLFTTGYIPDPAISVRAMAVLNFNKGYSFGESEQIGIAVSEHRYIEKLQTVYIGFFSFGAAIKHPDAVAVLQMKTS